MLRAESSARALSGAHRQRIIAVRERTWGEFCDAVTRSQTYKAAWRYLRLAGAYEDQGPEAVEIFQEYFAQIVEYLQEARFERGRGHMTVAEYRVRWLLTEEEDEEWRSLGGGMTYVLGSAPRGRWKS